MDRIEQLEFGDEANAVGVVLTVLIVVREFGEDALEFPPGGFLFQFVKVDLGPVEDG